LAFCVSVPTLSMWEAGVRDERQLRQVAVDLFEQGSRLTEIAAELGRSREWVRKWLNRYRNENAAGLDSRSRRPHTNPSRLSETVRDEICAVRALLEADRHANRDAAAIQAEIETRAVIDTVPSLSSIKRVLSERGLTRPYQKRRRSKIPTLGLPKVATPGIWQQADWVQDRHLQGAIRFNSLQIADVGSHMVSAGQHRRRTLADAASQLTEQAWPHLSIPLAMSTDNAFAKTSHTNNPFTVWVRLLLMFGVETIISPPNSLGFTNHIEAVNALWQSRTIYRHRYKSLEHLKADNTVFLEWVNTRRAILDPDIYGTRYPAEHVANYRQELRWPPDGFTLADYHDPSAGHQIPLTKGRVTFLRYTDTANTVTIAHTRWPVPATFPAGVLVIATINTATAQLEIRHSGELITSHTYPITPAHIDPIWPLPTTGLLDHLPTMS